MREYWIVDPAKRTIEVHCFFKNEEKEYSFYDTVPAGIYEDFAIDFNKLIKFIHDS